MAVVKEISKPGYGRIRILDDAYAHLSEEEIARRNQQIKDHFNVLVRQHREKQQALSEEDT